MAGLAAMNKVGVKTPMTETVGKQSVLGKITRPRKSSKRKAPTTMLTPGATSI